jgi:hypothetical protein
VRAECRPLRHPLARPEDGTYVEQRRNVLERIATHREQVGVVVGTSKVSRDGATWDDDLNITYRRER